jgi:citrate lyase subunit beta/citryl-CoA lyase
MRSLLFAPGGSARMTGKALAGEADAVILDLEDAVQPAAKDAARGLVAEALGQAARPHVYVRVNALDTAWCEADVAAIVPCRPHGLMLPKPNGPHDVERLSRLIAAHEPADRAGATRILAVCTESPAAVLSLAAASWRHPRLEGMLWGGEDLSVGLGATGNRDVSGAYTSPFRLARDLCLMAARAAGVIPIDAVFTDFRNPEGLAQEAAAARRDGFAAKAAIHPFQVPVINAAFTPSPDEIRWAERVVAALDGAAAGAVQLDGAMIDMVHLAQARRILAMRE